MVEKSLQELLGAQVSPELLKLLDRLFPERSPKLTESHDALMWRGGERNVVSILRAAHVAATEASSPHDTILR